jgi:hypothetical protein
MERPTDQPDTDEPPRMRARLVGVVVSLEVVADDGVMLHPIDLQPIRVPANEWSGFSLDVALAQIQAQLEGKT